MQPFGVMSVSPADGIFSEPCAKPTENSRTMSPQQSSSSATFTISLSEAKSPIQTKCLQLYVSYLEQQQQDNSAVSFQIYKEASNSLPVMRHESENKTITGPYAIILYLERYFNSIVASKENQKQNKTSDASGDSQNLLRCGAGDSAVDRANAYAYTQMTVADVRNNLSRFNTDFLRHKTFALNHSLSIADFYLFVLLVACQDNWNLSAGKKEGEAFLCIKRYFNHVKGAFSLKEEQLKSIFPNLPKVNTQVKPFEFKPVPEIHQKPAAAPAAAKKGKAPAAAQQKQNKKGAAAAEGKKDAAKGGKKDKKEKKKKAKPQPKAKALSPYLVDIRVGKIVEAKKHPDAEKLYIEKIDIGEDQPRTIVSGLYQKIPLEKLQDSLCLVMVNLKPATMVGVESRGMLLSAVSSDEKFDTLCIPEGTKVGERVLFTGADKEDPDKQVNSKKLRKYMPSLKTDDKGQVIFEGSIAHICRTSAGIVTSPFKNGIVA